MVKCIWGWERFRNMYFVKLLLGCFDVFYGLAKANMHSHFVRGHLWNSTDQKDSERGL